MNVQKIETFTTEIVFVNKLAKAAIEVAKLYTISWSHALLGVAACMNKYFGAYKLMYQFPSNLGDLLLNNDKYNDVQMQSMQAPL